MHLLALIFLFILIFAQPYRTRQTSGLHWKVFDMCAKTFFKVFFILSFSEILIKTVLVVLGLLVVLVVLVVPVVLVVLAVQPMLVVQA